MNEQAGQDVVAEFLAGVARLKDDTRQTLLARIAELEAGPVQEWRELKASLEALDSEYAGAAERSARGRTPATKTKGQKRRRVPEAVREERLAALEDLVSREPGLTGLLAAEKLGISNGYVSGLARELRASGRLGPGPGLIPPSA